jgi:hypothetical protein
MISQNHNDGHGHNNGEDNENGDHEEDHEDTAPAPIPWLSSRLVVARLVIVVMDLVSGRVICGRFWLGRHVFGMGQVRNINVGHFGKSIRWMAEPATLRRPYMPVACA